jgi:hypothetical protein
MRRTRLKSFCGGFFVILATLLPIEVLAAEVSAVEDYPEGSIVVKHRNGGSTMWLVGGLCCAIP